MRFRPDQQGPFGKHGNKKTGTSPAEASDIVMYVSIHAHVFVAQWHTFAASRDAVGFQQPIA